jgi:hypothetical protein
VSRDDAVAVEIAMTKCIVLVLVADECGTPVVTVAGQITRNGWSFPLLSGTPLTIPTPGDYTVVDPIGWDLMGTPPPACSLTLKVSLAPMQH